MFKKDETEPDILSVAITFPLMVDLPGGGYIFGNFGGKGVKTTWTLFKLASSPKRSLKFDSKWT